MKLLASVAEYESRSPCFVQLQISCTELGLFHTVRKLSCQGCFCCRPMSPDHPACSQQIFKEYWQSKGKMPSLQCYTDYVQAKEKAESIKAQEAGQKPARKSAGLQYSDLYGVPTILVLCEKGEIPAAVPPYCPCTELPEHTTAAFMLAFTASKELVHRSSTKCVF